MPTLVELSAFNPNWASDFSAAEVLLRTRLAKYVVSIDHIGSTAVPGLTAKPIIDIDITVSSLDDVPGATVELIKIGFEPRGNRYDDDVWAFLWKRRTPQIRVYLCPPPQTGLMSIGCSFGTIFGSMTRRLPHMLF